MPMFELTYPEGALEPDARAELVDRLSAALLRHEGAPADNERVQGMAWGFLREVPDYAINIAGRRVARPAYRLEITVPAGTLLHGPGPVGVTSRRNLVREATEIILAAEGREYTPQESLRIYCIIREIEDGYWGGAGTTLRMEDIVAIGHPEAGDTPLAAEIRGYVDEILPIQLGSEAVSA